MKKILSVLLLAAACILSGCEPKEPEVEKAKLTIVNNYRDDIVVWTDKYDTGERLFKDIISPGGSVAYILECNKYKVYTISTIPSQSYIVELTPGSEKTVSFK